MVSDKGTGTTSAKSCRVASVVSPKSCCTFGRVKSRKLIRVSCPPLPFRRLCADPRYQRFVANATWVAFLTGSAAGRLLWPCRLEFLHPRLRDSHDDVAPSHAGRVVRLAFLDEAKPSRRLVKTLNELDEKHGRLL